MPGTLPGFLAMRLIGALLIVGGCTEYGIAEQKDPQPLESAVGAPAIVVTPEAVALVICGAGEATVTISNEGDAALGVESVSLSGDGWSLADPTAFPRSIAPGASAEVPLVAGPGDATLTIVSDDPHAPEVTVPLSAVADAPPTVGILAPLDGDVVGEGAPLTLAGLVGDDLDAADALAVEWSSSAAGVLSTAPATATGDTQVDWPAELRPGGSQTVTLAATDSCGQTTTAAVAICQDGAYTFDPLDLSSWHYEGVAAWNAESSVLELTEPTTDSVGSAFELSAPVNGELVDVDFLFFIGGGSGADGISLTVLDTSRMTGFLGGDGCGIGYGGNASCTDGPALPGWSLEVDTYENGEVDFTAADHVAFSFDGNLSSPAAQAVLPEMEDTGWHSMHVSVVAPHVTVEVDGTTYIDQDVVGSYSFTGYVGFTAGTGSLTNWHVIDSLEVTDYLCE